MTWSDGDLLAKGYGPDGRRLVPRYPGTTAAANPGTASSHPGPPSRLSQSARSRLKPEQLLQVEVIEALRPRLVPGAKLCSLNGELPGGTDLFVMWQAIRKAMGYEAGTPDLVAWHNGQTLFIELKRPVGEPDLLGHRKARGELSGQQRTWRDWAVDEGFPWVCARSVAEVEAALKGWGMTA